MRLTIPLFLLGLLAGFGAMGYADGERQAIVLKINGTVEARLGQGEWMPAAAGMKLNQNDELRTGKDSLAKILLDKDGETGQFDLKSESRMRLYEMAMNPETGLKTTVLDLAIGSVLVHAEKLQGDSKFQVRTPNSTTGVRGTTFLVTAEPKRDKDPQP